MYIGCFLFCGVSFVNAQLLIFTESEGLSLCQRSPIQAGLLNEPTQILWDVGITLELPCGLSYVPQSVSGLEEDKNPLCDLAGIHTTILFNTLNSHLKDVFSTLKNPNGFDIISGSVELDYPMGGGRWHSYKDPDILLSGINNWSWYEMDVCNSGRIDTEMLSNYDPAVLWLGIYLDADRFPGFSLRDSYLSNCFVDDKIDMVPLLTL